MSKKKYAVFSEYHPFFLDVAKNMQGQDTFKDFKVILQFHRSSHAPVTPSQFRNYLEEIGAINHKASLKKI